MSEKNKKEIIKKNKEQHRDYRENYIKWTALRLYDENFHLFKKMPSNPAYQFFKAIEKVYINKQ